MARSQYFGRLITRLAPVIVAFCFLVSSGAQAQSAKGKSKPKPLSAGEVKQIDSRLEKLQETFQTESTAIIESYERAGQYERAKFLLEVLLKLDPTNEIVKKRIAENDEHLLERGEFEQRFDVASDWTLVGSVRKDQAARVSASGEYKLTIASNVIGPGGFASDDPVRDLQPNIPTGALMGMIVTQESIRDQKAPTPFAIKTKHDFSPKQNGQLYLKVNVPPGSKCSGDLKLKLSGIVRTP